jgi:hypothetical protein
MHSTYHSFWAAALATSLTVATAQSHGEVALSQDSRDLIIFITLGVIGLIACATLWRLTRQKHSFDTNRSASVALWPCWTYSQRKWDQEQQNALNNSPVGHTGSYYPTATNRTPPILSPGLPSRPLDPRDPPSHMAVAVAIAVTNQGEEEELHVLQAVHVVGA